MSKKRLQFAQIQVLRWLQSRVEDQFVKAYIRGEIELLQRIGYPIADNGSELMFPKRGAKSKILPGQTTVDGILGE